MHEEDIVVKLCFIAHVDTDEEDLDVTEVRKQRLLAELYVLDEVFSPGMLERWDELCTKYSGNSDGWLQDMRERHVQWVSDESSVLAAEPAAAVRRKRKEAHGRVFRGNGIICAGVLFFLVMFGNKREALVWEVGIPCQTRRKHVFR